MALVQSRAVWMLVLLSFLSLLSSSSSSAAAAAAAASSCGPECARCVYALLGQQSAPLPPLACSLECGAALDSQTLRLCGETLMENDSELPLEDSQPEERADPKEEEDTSEHLLAKKYGGFMKRYGGFMARRSSSSAAAEGGAEETASTDGQENIRNEILRILNAATARGESGADAVKRYGGFMRRGGANVQSDALEAVLGRGLEKRYGGFMRRVGRPEWLVDSKSGVFKRAWESGSPLHKRYGGFMD